MLKYFVSVLLLVSVNTLLAENLKLISPNEGEEIHNTIVFKWTKVDSLLGYYIQISSDSTFQTLKANLFSDFEIFSLYPSPYVFQSGKYYWRVKAISEIDTFYSESRSFIYKLITSPINLLPADSATGLSLQPSLKWEHIFNKSYLPSDIHLTNGIDDFWFDADDYYHDSLKVPLGLLKPYTYYEWYVTETDEDFYPKNSKKTGFTTGDGIPQKPQLFTPTNNNYEVLKSFVFFWQLMDGASNYELHISKDSTFSIVDTIIVNTNKFNTDADKYMHDSYYFWRVKAVNKYGTSPWSDIFKFKIAPEPSVVFEYPKNGDTLNTVTPLIKWDFNYNYGIILKSIVNIVEKEDTVFTGFTRYSSYNIQIPSGILSPGSKYKIIILGETTFYSISDSIEFNIASLISTEGDFKRESFIFPNPAIDNISLTFSKALDDFANIEITDIRGLPIKKFSTYEALFKIDVSDLFPGLYFIKVKIKDKIHVEKLNIAR